MKILGLVVLLFVAMPQEALGQNNAPDKTFGDREVEAIILAQTRETYGKDTAHVFLMTSDNALRLDGSRGAELDGSIVGSDLVRIVATAFGNRGKYGVEYYFRDGALIFTYETFEYFSNYAPANAWQNFKHIAAWERRTYFRNGTIAYSASRGQGAPKPGANTRNLQDQARRFTALLATRPQVPTPQHQ